MTARAQPKVGQDSGENTSGYTGGMIALIPAGEHLPDLAVDGGLDPGELHLTLAYLGDDVTSWSPENQQAVLDQAQLAAQSVNGLVMARVFGHASFNPDGGPDGDRIPVLVYLVGDSQVLDALQQTVAAGLVGKDWIPEQHPNFFPHISAIQGTDSVPLTYTGPVVFDRLRVALGNDVTDISLAASADALRCEHCQHPVTRYGQDWRCDQDCQCIMRGCVLDRASRTLVEGTRMRRILRVDITGQCRAAHGDAGAWAEAFARLRGEYDAITRGWRRQSSQPVIRLVLEMERPDPGV